MEDDHVDRPGVEVRQRMKLTGTNSSIDLIVLILHAHRRAVEQVGMDLRHKQLLKQRAFR